MKCPVGCHPQAAKLPCEAIAQDDDLCLLKHIVQTDWPSHKEEVLLKI